MLKLIILRAGKGRFALLDICTRKAFLDRLPDLSATGGDITFSYSYGLKGYYGLKAHNMGVGSNLSLLVSVVPCCCPKTEHIKQVLVA